MNEGSHSSFVLDSEDGDSRKDFCLSTLGEISGDPILTAIDDFKAGFADYNANAPDDAAEANAYAERSYRPPRRVIEAWDKPARTRGGAIAALKLAKDADSNDDHALVGPMIGAALSYFEANV